MKRYKARSEKLISNEYIRASSKLEKTQKFSHPKKIISIRSVTPEGISMKHPQRKNQVSFSYVPKTKTPSVQPKAKLSGNYQYFKSGLLNKSGSCRNEDSVSKRRTQSKSITSNVGPKFSSRNSKQNTNSDTLCSIKSNRSKKGSNMTSNAQDKDYSYYERWKKVKTENKKLVNLLEDNNSSISTKVREYKVELELLSNLLLEVLPMLKYQVKLEDYNSKDFKKIGDSEGMQQKRQLLQKIKQIKTSKGFSTASSEDDVKIKLKLENAHKTIQALKASEANLLNRISQLELSEQSIKSQFKTLEYKYANLQNYTKVLDSKIKELCIEDYEDSKRTEVIPTPAFMKVQMLEDQLIDQRESDKFVFGGSEEFECESIHSTDENFIGIINNKPCIYLNRTDVSSSIWKKVEKKKLNKSAIGPQNLELKQCNKSSYFGGTTQSATIRNRIINTSLIGNNNCRSSNNLNNKQLHSYRPKYRFVKGHKDKVSLDERLGLFPH